MNTSEPDLTPEDVAVRYNVSMATLRRWRREGIGPPYRKITAQMIRYPAKSTTEYMDGCIQTCTSQD